MAFTSKLNYSGQFVASEIADATTSPTAASEGRTRVFGVGMNGNYSSAGTPALFGRIVEVGMTLAAADNDIDLTAAPLAADITKTVDLTGKKLVGYELKAHPDNTGNVTVKPHPATDPYHLFIGTDEPRTLEPGRHLQSMVAEDSAAGAGAVGAAAKNIRISGTVDDVVTATLVFA